MKKTITYIFIFLSVFLQFIPTAKKIHAADEPIKIFVGDSSIVAAVDGPRRILQFPVTLSRPSSTAVYFQYEIRNDSAKRDVDYLDNGKTKTLRFAVTSTGYTQTQQLIKVPLYDVPSTQDSKYFLITLHSQSANSEFINFEVNGTHYATGRILPNKSLDSSLPDVGVGDSNTYIGYSGKERVLHIPITLSMPSKVPVNVTYRVGGGTNRQYTFKPNSSTGLTPTLKYIDISNPPNISYKKSVQVPVEIIGATNATRNSKQIGYAIFTSNNEPTCQDVSYNLPSKSLFTNDISTLAQNDIWKIDYSDYRFNKLLHYNGLEWLSQTYPEPTPYFNGWDVLPSSGYYVFNISATPLGSVILSGIFKTGGGGVHGITYGTPPFRPDVSYPFILQYTGGNWMKYTNVPYQFDSIYTSSLIDSWGLKNDEYYHFDGAIWQKIPSCN